MQLVADYCEPAAKTETELIARLRAAFTQALSFHEILDDVDDQTLFKGAFLAVYGISGPEERATLLDNISAVIHVSAVLNGDTAAIDRIVLPARSLGLIGLWHEIKPSTDYFPPPPSTPAAPSNEERHTG